MMASKPSAVVSEKISGKTTGQCSGRRGSFPAGSP